VRIGIVYSEILERCPNGQRSLLYVGEKNLGENFRRVENSAGTFGRKREEKRNQNSELIENEKEKRRCCLRKENIVLLEAC